MGDVIMSSPAMRALKESFGSHITLLTSRAGALIAPYLDCVDDVITADLPWVRRMNGTDASLQALATDLASRDFDAAIIFTVYSQSALPAAMLAYMAGIPVRAAYARENPYDLLTTWVPDEEPYGRISHQVLRDLELVQAIGAQVSDDRLMLKNDDLALASLNGKLHFSGVDVNAAFIVLHPGVSEEKRQYPAELWIQTGKMLAERYAMPILISGSGAEESLAVAIAAGIGANAWSVAGKLSLGEFICLLECATNVVSVNTGTIHIAAAVQTPCVVLYAQTNPQHTPWKSPHEILSFSVPEGLKSRNTIIRDVASRLYADEIPYPQPSAVTAAVERLMGVTKADRIVV
jgi:ADP-heptose:LPS heptosyltransferase